MFAAGDYLLEPMIDMQSKRKNLMNILQGKHFFLKLIEVFLSALVLCGTVYFGVIALSNFVQRDWSSVTTMYDFIATILVVLLGFEVARLILVHSIIVVMELMLLVVARKMLYPDIPALDLVYCAVAFAVIVGVYYLYRRIPLKSLEDLTQ